VKVRRSTAVAATAAVAAFVLAGCANNQASEGSAPTASGSAAAAADPHAGLLYTSPSPRD
jgi:outer membrane lipoprotein SlyB